jgi:acyl transferase domain-containing protein
MLAAVTLVLTPSVGVSFALAGMTSARGRSHTFDARADGYARSEACGGVTLRHAEEGSSLAVLGSAVRQDGRSASLTAPNGLSQQALLAAALADAEASLESLVLYEAHGTGTALGDPIEVGSLAAATLKVQEPPLAVGSIKGNMGHAEPVAGMAGLLKLVLGLTLHEAASNAQLRALNPHLKSPLSGECFVVASQLSTCEVTGPKMGGVSSFGYGGTIVHSVAGLWQRLQADTPDIQATAPVILLLVG